MRIIIEEYKYAAADVKNVLKGIDALENVEGYVSVNYVGYFYNTDKDVRDCVFILPKVLLEDKEGKELVFGKYQPEEIINLDAHNPLTQQEKDFIYEFAVWIYRAIVVFHNDKRNKTSIVYHKKIAEVGKGGKHLSNTFLDILLSLVQFNKDNQDFFFYVLRNIHAGFNKINWNKTIGTTTAIIQDGNAVYLHPVNKKRQINFDEELLVIFFSILNYISEHYGFPVDINCNFELITGRQFKVYMNGMGKMRLKQIKYKYFSDKALQLWDLCYAFFDTARQIYVSTEQKEYLLVKNFNIVFEAIIDELVGDRNIPAGLKEQDDGKRIDHMYSYQGLTTHEEDKPIYYIGDSKYYKRGNQIGKESVYKQFTYARNVIQWNLNLFMNDDRDDEELQYDKKNFGNVPKLRDDVTEGYNVIPNFFISAKLNQELSYKDEVEITDKRNTHFSNNHFENRLFDRDTLLICHYDVNFLYVISLYARNNSLQKDAWKKQVRDKFRTEIQRMLTEQYSFYAMQAHPNVDAKTYLKEHFQQTLGKIFTPFGNDEIFSLALDKEDPEGNNEELLTELRKHFFVVENGIGENPTEPLATKVEAEGHLYQSDPSVDKTEKCVLTGYIPKSDSQFESFDKGKGKRFDMKYIPSINLMAVKYFMPMVDGFVDGYYKVNSMSFKTVKEANSDGTEKDYMYLHLSLGDFIKLGEERVFFYRVKMTAGQLHSISKIEENYFFNYMNINTLKSIIIVCLSYMFFSCSIEHIPSMPIVQYDSETSQLLIIQTDTAARDTASINIEGFYNKSIPVKDTITLNINKIVKDFDQVEFAYNLATHNNTQEFAVHTTRTNDTIFTYKYNTIDINPINVASIISGNCIGLYDVNYKRNYRDKIRLWIFKNKIDPDSLLIENMNSLIKQFNYSGHNEYAKLSGTPSILKTLKDTKYRFDVNLSGKYFYLYAAQDGSSIRSFIEKKISEGLHDAKASPKDEFTCNQSGKGGPNCLFMIALDENWKYTILPLGIVFVDNMAPNIIARGHRPNNRLYSSYMYSGLSGVTPSISWPNKIYLKSQDVLVKLPEPSTSLTSSVSVSYGSFEGNDYFGYNIPFYIDVNGDVQTVTIGAHKIDAHKIKSGDCIRLHMKGLHIGDNSIPLSATDVRGNKSTSSLSISIVSIRNNSSYDDDDYDDLDSRISDIESRLDDLE